MNGGVELAHELLSELIGILGDHGLRPLAQLDLPENAVVEIDVRDVPEAAAEQLNETTAEKSVRVLREAGLTSRLDIPVPDVELSDDERRRLSKLFSAGKPLSEIINEDREDRL